MTVHAHVPMNKNVSLNPAEEYRLMVRARATIKVRSAAAKKTRPRFFEKSPTEEILRQWGHRARALFRVLNWR